MDTVWHDLRYGARMLSKKPGFTLVAVITLALGIGATTAIFSVVDAVLLHPFPYADPDRILFLTTARVGQDGTMPVPYADFRDWRQQSQTFEHLAFAMQWSFSLSGGSEPARVRGAQVSASAGPLLGVGAELGRWLIEAEDKPGADLVCVLSHAAWQRHFAGDPAILNKSVMLDGQPHTVVGVMPPEFKFWAADIWTAAGLEADTDFGKSRTVRLGGFVVGKLKPAVAIEQARTEMKVITERLAQQYPDSNKGIEARLTRLSDSVTAGIRPALLMLLGAVGFVLLIACANVANLFLARAATRERELAIRAALGAGRGRVIRQLLVESLPLALLGGGAGLLLASWGLPALLAIAPADSIPAESRIRIDGRVLLFTSLVTLGTTLVFGLLPALQCARLNVNDGLTEGGRGGSSAHSARLRSGLVVVQVALSLALLVGAGLLLKSFGHLRSVDPGFNADNLLVMSLQLPASNYPTGQRCTAFFKDTVERLRHLPGVKAAAAGTNVPLQGASDFPLLVEGVSYSHITDLSQLFDHGVQVNFVLGDYFQAQGLRLLAGRPFTEADTAGSQPVIILNEAAAKRFLPDQAPLGKRVMLGLPGHLIKPGMLPAGLDKFDWSTVVGVVETARHFGLQTGPIPAVYIPVDQGWNITLLRQSMTILLRTAGDPVQVASAARQAVWGVDRNLPIERIASMESIIGETLAQPRFSTVLLGLFAVVAMLLAAVGIYGVMSWSVTQRTREIGLRLALGAQRKDVLWLVIYQGLRLALVGVTIGLLGAWGLTRVLSRLLYEVEPTDPLTFLVVAALLTFVTLLACYVPARRATKVDPMVALRYE
jgi:putative ABC transport system permease protein